MSLLVLILVAAVVAVGFYFYLDLQKGATSQPVKDPPKEPSAVATSPVIAASFPGQDLATKLGYYDPNRKVVDAKPVTRQTALVGDGGPVEHTTKHGVYQMPDVRAGQSIELEISRGYEPIYVAIRDYRGIAVVDLVGRVWDEKAALPTGAGNIRFVAPVAGNYTVELTGGGDLTTLNHWRR